MADVPSQKCVSVLRQHDGVNEDWQLGDRSSPQTDSCIMYVIIVGSPLIPLAIHPSSM